MSFTVIFLFTGLFINRTISNNEILGYLNTTSDLDANTITDTFNEFETKILNDMKLLNANAQEIDQQVEYAGISSTIVNYSDYKKNIEEIFKENPVIGLHALRNITKKLASEGRYHKVEVELLRSIHILNPIFNDYNYSHLQNRDDFIVGLFDDLQSRLIESIYRQRLKSDTALELFRELIKKIT